FMAFRFARGKEAEFYQRSARARAAGEGGQSKAPAVQNDAYHRHMMVETRRTEGGLAVDLTGEWRALSYGQIDAALAAVDLAGLRQVEISTERLTALDLTGAWRLREFVRRARSADVAVALGRAPRVMEPLTPALRARGTISLRRQAPVRSSAVR